MKANISRLFFALLCALAILSPAHAADKETKGDPKHVEAAAAAKLLKDDPKVIVLDIRTPDEFSAGHIKGAKNVDFYADDFAARVAKLDKDKSYLVHCASGGRSGKSLELFKQLGFKSIYHLDGGFKGWQKAGEPVEK